MRPFASENGTGPDGSASEAPETIVVSLEEFIAVEEEGAEPLVGEPGSVFIPAGADAMFFGDGGAGKTTLLVDLAFHLAACDDWLGIPIPRPVPVTLIENEGPRPLFRDKLRRKFEAWKGSPLDGRLRVLERPWAQFTFAKPEWRASRGHDQGCSDRDADRWASEQARHGCRRNLGGVNAFMAWIKDLRAQLARPLTVSLAHHENKGGAVSGAWEGAGDTLVHVQDAGNGRTVMHVQKARWDQSRHKQTSG